MVGLLCNWKQERGANAANKEDDFLLWLTNHNFNELRSRIEGSAELQRELNALLRQDTAELSERIELLCRGIAGLSEKLEGFAPLTRAIGTKAEVLSDQAIWLLQTFEASEAMGMVHLQRRGAVMFVQGNDIDTTRKLDSRFLEDDLRTLEGLGLITVARYNTDGEPVFALTRLGAECAPQLVLKDHGSA